RINRFLRKARNHRIDVAAGAGMEHFDLLAYGRSGSSDVREKGSVTGKLGSTSTAMRPAPGSNSCKSPSCFAARVATRKVTPLTLPPGGLRLATRPSLTGSPPLAKTIGIVVVAVLAAIVEGVSCAAITATWRRIRSAARSGSRSYWSCAQRYSIAT